MILYEQIDKKKSRILKRFSKYAVHDAPFFTKFCFALTYFLRIAAIIAAIINVICSFYQNDYYLLNMLIVSFGFTYMFSFIPYTYYYVKLTAEYRQRKKETIILDNGIFKYAYDCSPSFSKQTIIFKIPLSKIKSCEYNEKTKQCVVKGDFSYEIYDYDKLVETNDDTCKMIDFFEVYDVEIYNLIRQKRCSYDNRRN